MSATDINIEEISVRDKRALLAELLRRRVSKPVVAPLSFAQQRLWFLDQLEPGSPLYNVHSTVRLQGRVDVEALEQSFEFMVQRHETLRTTFQLQNGMPVQVIQSHAGPVIERYDLEENLSRKGAKAQSKTQKDLIGDILEEEALKPFDLASGPLLRVKLLRLEEDDHVLLLTMHHIVSDGWSMGVLISEVVALYEAFSKGQTRSLPRLPIQYADFARWQREWLTGDVLAKQLGYWQKQLDDVATLQLPTDRPRPLIQSHRGARQGFALPRDLSESLITLARTEGVTLFTLLLAAWQTLLTRYTEQTDIAVGSPIANRSRVETESLIGFFVNTLVLRTDSSGNPTFRELLGRVRSVVLDAQAHQDVPFEKIVEELQLERSLSHTPLFQVVFALHNTPAQVIDLPDLKLTSLDVQRRTAKFDLLFELFERNGNISGSLEYSTDLFNDTTITRLLDHYRRLLSAVVDDPEQKILDLPLLSDAEQLQLLYEWNEVSPNTELEQPLHELFEEQVQRTPDQIALVLEDEKLTYSELNARASRLAQHLCELGVGPETLVGIFMERSIEMVVAILGILKAGGAYLPLDPSYPRERLRFIVEDAKPAVIVTQEALRSVAGELGEVLTTDDTDQSRGSDPDLLRRFDRCHPSNPAYVIYTSGSTGTPKGVVVTHANVVRLFTATRKWFNFDANDVWTLFHSYAFDFSVWELWGALLYGGRLVMVPYLVSRQPEAFYQLLLKERVTVLNQTPSAFRQLMQAEQSSWPNASEAPPLALRFVIFGGEALELQSLGPWFDRHGDEQPLLVNMYGITETTVHVTYRPIRKSDLLTATGSVIGERIPDLQIYVLDAARKSVPIGVPGELYVGGAGLARGYLRRPALTAERFVLHSWAGEGARLYRTGDRGRYLANGDLEYLGRVDRQVKVRGFRIELGEIEAVLAQHKDVSESVVVARDDDGETRLVAYVVAADEQVLTVGDLRNHMKQRLPEYMVPSAFVLLDRLPLTTNGKVDRRALPAPEESRLDLGEAYVAPETEAERILADVWAEVLRAERIGVCDNFFALGGDSIRSVQVLSLAKERGLSFSLQQLFEYQTIRELARAIDSEVVTPEQSRRSEPFSLMKDEDRQKLPADVVDAYPLSRLQLGMLYHLEATPGVSVYHNINSFHLKARLNEEFFVRAVRHVVERHDVLRTSFNLSGYSEPLQLVHREAELPVQFEDLRKLSAADQQEVIRNYTESEQRNWFDLSRPALLRFRIHRRTDETFQFTLTECHAILDGWSLQSTLAEIFETYFAVLRNASIPEHKPFATSFRDFIALEQASLESEECIRFWRNTLSDATVTEIAPWPAETRATGRKRARKLVVHIPEEVSEGLHRVAVNAGVPLKSVLLAAHLKVMSLVMGQSDVITGLVCNGRPEETDGELIRGLFLNVVPFRQRVGARNWTEYVRDTFMAERDLLPFRRYPLPAIQEQLNTPSFFETTFNYVHYHVLDGVLGQGDVEIIFDQVEGYEETNFTLNAGFMSDVLTSRIMLRVAIDTTKLSDPQAEAIRGYYERVLAAMARDTLNPLETEPFLDDAERHKVLVEWNDTARDFPHDTCFHQLFERQVERTPDAEAVVFGDRTLSYRELNSRANQLAHHLRAQGVGPETLVGISVERSIEMVVGILGILKAGGAFVPLDPAYPRERLAFMIEDSGIQVLLTQERLVEILDSSDKSYRSYSDENLDSNTTPQNAAYVIYTSGSTGTPKGVVIAHGGMCNLATAQIRAFNVQPWSRVLQFAALSFDASVSEFAMALLRGATLVIAPREDLMPGERLISLLRDHAITTVTFPPSVLALLPPEEFPALRTIIVAGEACWAELVVRWAVNGRLFCNAYGPTENTVCISIAECAPDGRKPTIGRPLANVQVYVLDENMRPAPLGVPGEIYAGGEGLARAYLNRPDLTATRFVPNPYSSVPGARLYRTGDRGRYLPDGQLEFLGRVDQQVKLRGFRIELGEIEAVLCRHDAVCDAVVVAREERNREKRLVAYVVGEAPATELPGQLRNYLQERLPDYMVPSVWVKLDSLPLTTNGKVDRKALPAPDSQRPELSSAYIAPRSAIERDIAAVWQEVLGIENVGVNDNFFDLGGHSLQAVRVHGKLRAKFEKNLLLFELFQFPSIAAMAKYISNDYTEESSAEQGVERAETRRELRNRRRQLRRAVEES